MSSLPITAAERPMKLKLIGRQHYASIGRRSNDKFGSQDRWRGSLKQRVMHTSAREKEVAASVPGRPNKASHFLIEKNCRDESARLQVASRTRISRYPRSGADTGFVQKKLNFGKEKPTACTIGSSLLVKVTTGAPKGSTPRVLREIARSNQESP